MMIDMGSNGGAVTQESSRNVPGKVVYMRDYLKEASDVIFGNKVSGNARLSVESSGSGVTHFTKLSSF
jgi:hypothetical protein